MAVNVHDWILDRVLPEETITEFKPNGQTLASGIPIGKIITKTRRVVEARRVGPYGGPFTGVGGVSGVGTATLTISTAGGGTKTFSATSGDTPGEGYWRLDETCEGVADLILGLYTFRGKFVSEADEFVIGGWAG